LAPGVICGQVFQALPDSWPDAAAVELPKGVVPFSIGVAPGQDRLGFAQVVHFAEIPGFTRLRPYSAPSAGRGPG
jgi:hypothetical protein